MKRLGNARCVGQFGAALFGAPRGCKNGHLLWQGEIRKYANGTESVVHTPEFEDVLAYRSKDSYGNHFATLLILDFRL
jgi:hypothetical protein